MKKLMFVFAFVLFCSTTMIPGQAMALSLYFNTPGSEHETFIFEDGDPPVDFSVDLMISGLDSAGPGNTRALLGAFELDLVFYDTTLVKDFKFTITTTSVDYDIYLGDESLGEAMVDENGTISGILGPPLLWTLHLDEVSLLEESQATCIWCWPPYLEDLQGDSFRLATLNFNATGLNGVVTMFMSDVVLSDPDGMVMDPENGFDPATFDVHTVNVVPEPSTYVLFSCGLLGLCFLIKRKRISG